MSHVYYDYYYSPNPYSNPHGLGAVDDAQALTLIPEPPEQRSLLREFIDDPSQMPASIAQQIISIIPGIAGGLAGFYLAYRLANTRKVGTAGVLASSLLVAAVTFGAIYLVRDVGESEEPEVLP